MRDHSGCRERSEALPELREEGRRRGNQVLAEIQRPIPEGGHTGPPRGKSLGTNANQSLVESWLLHLSP